MIPSAAAVRRCDPTSPARLWASSVPARRANTVGIIRYVAPFSDAGGGEQHEEAPEEGAESGGRQGGDDGYGAEGHHHERGDRHGAAAEPVGEAPPSGRARLPMSAPVNASESVAEPTPNAEKDGNWSAMSFGNTLEKPMNDPNVPM